MLLPSLEEAVRQAQLAHCGSNLHAMGIASLGYGMDNKSQVTRFSSGQFQGRSDHNNLPAWWHWPNTPKVLNYLGWWSVPGYRDAYGVGYHTGPTHLYFDQRLPSAKSFYCVGDAIRHETKPGEANYSDGGFFRIPVEERIIGSYAYNPMSSFYFKEPSTQRWYDPNAWNQGYPAERNAGRAVLAMDVLSFQDKSNHGADWNLHYFDGSVSRGHSERIAQLEKTGGLVNEWFAFDPQVEELIIGR